MSTMVLFRKKDELMHTDLPCSTVVSWYIDGDKESGPIKPLIFRTESSLAAVLCFRCTSLER